VPLDTAVFKFKHKKAHIIVGFDNADELSNLEAII
jgi:hypothetical protein